MSDEAAGIKGVLHRMGRLDANGNPRAPLPDFLLARIAEEEDAALATEHADGPHTLHWSVAGRRRSTFENGRSEDYVAVACGDWDRIMVARDAPGDRPATVSTHIARHDPARVLVECDAKRRIVKMHATLIGDLGDECRVCVHDHPCATLRLLALPYAEHSDYNEEWRL